MAFIVKQIDTFFKDFFRAPDYKVMIRTAGADFVDRIDTILKQSGIKRAELASRAGLAPQAIVDWKRRGSIPPGDVCLTIAQELKAPVEWLLTGKGPSTSSGVPALPPELEPYLGLTAEKKRDVVKYLLYVRHTMEEERSQAAEIGSMAEKNQAG